jgi:hypothetical protein
MLNPMQHVGSQSRRATRLRYTPNTKNPPFRWGLVQERSARCLPLKGKNKNIWEFHGTVASQWRHSLFLRSSTWNVRGAL